MTIYDEFDEYAVGDGWDYNDEMQALFADRFGSGPVSERPTAAEAPDNAKFLAEDESIIYRNDPSNGWVVAGFGTDTDRIPEAYFESVVTEEAAVGNVVAKAAPSADQTVPNDTVTQLPLDNVLIEDTDVLEVDANNDEIIANVDGTFLVNSIVTYRGSSNWSVGDRFESRINPKNEVLKIGSYHHGGTDEPITGIMRSVVEMANGDTVAQQTRHVSGSDETVHSAEQRTYFEVVRIG